MKIRIKPEDITYTLLCLEEDLPIEENASACDEETDAKVEQWIKNQLNSGNPWAWCCVHLRGAYVHQEKTYTADDYLGACSYASQEDFEKDGYYEDMKEMIAAEISKQISDEESKALMAQACNALVDAYERGGENGGSVAWEDVDDAYVLAEQALL
ncbi:MAG: hypothetical protein WDA42_00855 [Candidatus Bathyarchaeia archaeon]